MNNNLEVQKKIVSKYIYAKDNNKPHMMKDIFTKNAILNMELETKNISFPSESMGLDSITNVLVKEFNKSYENVYSFCFLDSIKGDNEKLVCKWLVIMSSKENDTLRIGYGTYKWSFDKDKNFLIKQLVISIEEMVILEEKFIYEMMNWIGSIPYPWCNTKNVLQNMPSLELLKPIKNINKK